MAKILVIEYASLDGVIQAPGHEGEDRSGRFKHGGWTGPFMAEHEDRLNGLFATAGGFLLGRLTYDIWAPFWPTVTDPDNEIATALNNRPKYVASTTLIEPAWAGTTVIRDVPAEVAKLRDQPGGPVLVMGSSVLTHTLTRHRLVDEYQIWLHPVVLGTGKKLFSENGPRLSLELSGCTVTAGGLVILSYIPDSHGQGA